MAWQWHAGLSEMQHRPITMVDYNGLLKNYTEIIIFRCIIELKIKFHQICFWAGLSSRAEIEVMRGSHDVSPLTCGLNYRSACDTCKLLQIAIQ